MRIQLLSSGYKNNRQLYLDFINDNINFDGEIFSDRSINVEGLTSFPIYFNITDDQLRLQKLEEAVTVIYGKFLPLGPELYLDESFWHSYLISSRDYIIDQYGHELIQGYSKFQNIVLKKFDWENYIYKALILAISIKEMNLSKEEQHEYISFVNQNLDLFNYLIKTTVFRNVDFVYEFLSIIKELEIGPLLKGQVKNKSKKDERIGRNIIQDLNFNYPMQVPHFYDRNELKFEIINILERYVSEADFEKLVI